MLAICSNGARYALHAVIFLSAVPPGQRIPVREIAEKAGIPRFVLAKIVLDLVRAGILRSHKGPKGGIHLAKDPTLISLGAVMEAVDGRTPLHTCALGVNDCPGPTVCALHAHWSRVRSDIAHFLGTTTIDDILKGRVDAHAASC
jgi:Rrf2 family protein